MNSHKQAQYFGSFSGKQFGQNSEKKIAEKEKNAIYSEGVVLSLREGIEEYTLMAKVEGRAEKTLNLYDYVLGRFTDFLSEDFSVGEIDSSQVRKYLSKLMDEGLRNTSVAIHHRVLKAFFNWLVEEGYLNNAPTDRVNKPKTPKKYPRYLNEDQVSTLLSASKRKRNTWAGYRNHTIIICFLDMGLRLNELVTAKLNDLSFDNRSLKVHGKGAKDRLVFFGIRTHKTLRHWLKIRNKKGELLDETLFITERGERLKKRYVQHIVTDLQEAAGLEEIKLSPHVLRHTAATMAVKNGMDPFTLKRIFGWEQIETAMRYIHISDKSLEESYKNSSPVDNLSA